MFTALNRAQTIMLSLRRIIFVDKKIFLCIACVVSVFIVVDINTRSHLLHRKVYLVDQTDVTKLKDRPPVFAIFVVIPSNNNLSIATGQTDQLRYFKLPDCDATKSFHLYLLRYTEEPALTTKQSFINYFNE